MIELNTLIAQFVFPFPAKVFEKELKEAQVDFRSEFIPSSEGAVGSCIYYVKTEDFDKADDFKAKSAKGKCRIRTKVYAPICKVSTIFSFDFVCCLYHN